MLYAFSNNRQLKLNLESSSTSLPELNAIFSPIEKMEMMRKRKELLNLDVRGEDPRKAHMKQLLTHQTVVYRAIVFLSRKMGSDWAALYKALNFEPDRPDYELEKDITDARNSKLSPIKLLRSSESEVTWNANGNREGNVNARVFERGLSVSSSAGSASSREKEKEVASSRENKQEEKACLACLKKWLVWQQQPSVEQLYEALCAIGRRDLQRELQGQMDAKAWGWL